MKKWIKGHELSYRQHKYKDDVAIVTLEGSFYIHEVKRKGFHKIESGTLGDFNPKGKVYFHYVSLNM